MGAGKSWGNITTIFASRPQRGGMHQKSREAQAAFFLALEQGSEVVRPGSLGGRQHYVHACLQQGLHRWMQVMRVQQRASETAQPG